MTIHALCASYRADIIVRRWAAAWLDFATLFVAVAAAAALRPETSEAVVGVFACGLGFMYFTAGEGMWGITVGEWLSGVRVVTDGGSRPGLRRAGIRTLLRLIEVNPVLLGGIPAGLIVDKTRHRQRIGDLLAGTYVVKYADLRHHFPASPVARLRGPVAWYLEAGLGRKA